MRVLPPVQTTGPVTSFTADQAANLRLWQVGTILRAVALEAPAEGRVRLQIGTQVVSARTSVPLDAGQNLRLRVAATTPQVVLQNVTPRAAETAAQALRQTLPQQTAPAPLLSTLQSLNARADTLPTQLSDAVRQLSNALRPAQTLTGAEGVRQAIRESGLFLEARLAHSTLPADRSWLDWKAALLRFRHQLSTVAASPRPDAAAPRLSPPVAVAETPMRQQTPPLRHAMPPPAPAATAATLVTDPDALLTMLTRQVDGVLARISVAQLNSLPAADAGERQSWLLEMPVRHADGSHEVLAMRIDQDEHTVGGRRERGWTVNLAFDLGALGPLRARISFRSGRVSATLWAELEQTGKRIRRRLGELSRRLERRELDVAALSCGTGCPPDPGAAPQTLLDARA